MPQTILVVDDELFELRRIHVEGSALNFYETIADTTDPVFESLCTVARSIDTLAHLVEDDVSAAAYFATDKAVQDVLLDAAFNEKASPDLKCLLEPFLARARHVGQLKDYFQSAFPQPEFVVRFAGAPRPPVAQVIECAAVFLDLFLEDGVAGPIDALQKYLRSLAEQAGHSALPPIVLMSLHAELDEHKLEFSEHSQISAAGLMVLPKGKIAEVQFGAAGLRLSFDQLSRQSAVAHAMRLFIASWMRAHERATTNTAKTLWNLDASAMQQIHFASVSDDDPYDEHLNELLSRAHLYCVEADADVGAKLQELDSCFRGHLSDDGRISNRLIAPLTDVITARALMSRFTWLGSRPAQPFLNTDEKECARHVSRTLPFGSVLCGPVLLDKMRCLVHVTQQCDLNSIARLKATDATLVFAVAEARELQVSDNPNPLNSELVAKSLWIDEGNVCREFDLHLLVGELLAMPLRDFNQCVREEELRVVGRLRSDITNHIVAATTNHMSRPASQKMLRPALLRAKVFLQSAKLPGGKSPLMGAENKAKIFSLTQEVGIYSFQDDACVEIALWLAHQLTQIGIQVEVAPLCAALRTGWRAEKQLVGSVVAKVRECKSLVQAFKELAATVTEGDEVNFTVIFER